MLSRDWRCSWSSADNWVVDNFIALLSCDLYYRFYCIYIYIYIWSYSIRILWNKSHIMKFSRLIVMFRNCFLLVEIKKAQCSTPGVKIIWLPTKNRCFYDMAEYCLHIHYNSSCVLIINCNISYFSAGIRGPNDAQYPQHSTATMAVLIHFCRYIYT